MNTLHDYAIAALQGIVASSSAAGAGMKPKQAAVTAWDYAEAMEAERRRRKHPGAEQPPETDADPPNPPTPPPA